MKHNPFIAALAAVGAVMAGGTSFDGLVAAYDAVTADTDI